ncbi:hypothetical protein [Pantoea endophytica]|uniref:hypothetical protein n=1 Tax=Pantoea endophytica TaxID=92488 RepID=UPI00301ADDC3
MEFANEHPAFHSARQIYQVLVMYYLDGKKQSEIAVETGCLILLAAVSIDHLLNKYRAA